ncbi:MAG TPA: SGNH/GDSL hydrolase family protein [Planctomycetia bacterium]|nr:SGNH/GDSL hydrolase family protein [Planctomycetia bacterium]
MPRSRRVLSPAKRRCFAVLAAAMVLFAGELAARGWLRFFASPEAKASLALPGEVEPGCKYVPHPYCAYAAAPNYVSGETHHDSRGFRGGEVVAPKPPGVFRIAVLGGSTTYGEFIPRDEDAFPAQLERILRAEFGCPQVEVVNAGVPGYNSWESLVDFEFRVLDVAPDLVIPYFGVNDVHARMVDPAEHRSDNLGRRKAWSEPWEVRVARCSLLARMLGRATGVWQPPGVENFTLAPGALKESRRGDHSVLLAANPPTYFRRNLESTVAVARAHRVAPVLATWACSFDVGDYVALPHYRQGVRELNDVVRSVAAASGAPCFDFAAVMPSDPRYWRDGRHVNASGAEFQARAFAQYLHSNYLIKSLAEPVPGMAGRSDRVPAR